jgi:hypothetical protein
MDPPRSTFALWRGFPSPYSREASKEERPSLVETPIGWVDLKHPRKGSAPPACPPRCGRIRDPAQGPPEGTEASPTTSNIGHPRRGRLAVAPYDASKADLRLTVPVRGQMERGVLCAYQRAGVRRACRRVVCRVESGFTSRAYKTVPDDRPDSRSCERAPRPVRTTWICWLVRSGGGRRRPPAGPRLRSSPNRGGPSRSRRFKPSTDGSCRWKDLAADGRPTGPGTVGPHRADRAARRFPAHQRRDADHPDDRQHRVALRPGRPYHEMGIGRPAVSTPPASPQRHARQPSASAQSAAAGLSR